MKKTLTILLFSFLFLDILVSQKSVNVSVRAGVNSSTYRYKYSSGGYGQPQNVSLLTIGIPVELNFSPLFSLQTGLDFMQKGYRFQSTFGSPRVNRSSDIRLITNWLEVPILSKIKFKIKNDVYFSVLGGLSFGVGVYGKVENNFVDYDWVTQYTTGFSSNEVVFVDDHNPFDLGLNLGGEISYKKMYFDFRYQLGISDTKSKGYNNYAISSSKTRSAALTIGYRFFTKKT
jgi:hypothetical protein